MRKDAGPASVRSLNAQQKKEYYMPLLECQNLTLGYEGKAVVSGLSFTVNDGDYLCVVGENGSGKSTLIRTILKLKAPVSGQILTDNRLRSDGIGYLPQQSETQKDFPASVREVVLSGCLNRCGLRPYYNTEEKQIALENMEKLGISALEKSCFSELSGGQKQRVLLARALCAARKILLLDEPASGLDPAAASEMYALIAQLNENGTTIIMISHDIASSVKYASHILHIGNHSVQFFGLTADYLKSGAGRSFNTLGDELI